MMRRYLILVVLLFAALMIVANAARARRTTGAVCTTDADCAAWEARTGVPEAARCYGAPCPR